MLKTTSVALALSLAVTLTPMAQTERARDREGLAGPVRSVQSEWVYVEKAAAGITETGKRKPMDTVTFDAAGNYVERDIVDDYGFPVGKKTYRYENDRLFETRLADPKGALLEREEFVYAPIERVTITGADGRAYTESYRRGSLNRLEQITYSANGAELGKTVFKFAEGDKPSEAAFFLPGDRPATAPVGPCQGAHRLVYRYAAGRVSEQDQYEADGTLARHSAYKYDSHGNVVEERREGPVGALMQYEYVYDDHGNWTRRTATVDYSSAFAGILGSELAGMSGSPLIRVTFRIITYF